MKELNERIKPNKNSDKKIVNTNSNVNISDKKDNKNQMGSVQQKMQVKIDSQSQAQAQGEIQNDVNVCDYYDDDFEESSNNGNLAELLP